MKKMYDKTLRGYYVMSVVLGLLLAVAVATMLEVVVLDGISASSGRLNMALDDLWGYLPLNLCNIFWNAGLRLRYLNVLMVTTAIMSVGIFVRMSGTKGSRAKILQAMSVAILALLLMLAYGWATRRWIANAALALVPVVLMVIPLTILRKTQQPVEGGLLGVICQERIHGWWLSIKRFVRENRTFVVIVLVALVLLTCVVVPGVLRARFVG